MRNRDRKLELDANTKEYLAPTPDREVDQKIVRWVAEHLIRRVAADRVLELGVGDQIWTPKLVDTYAQVVTVDGSAGLLSAMKAALRGKAWKPVCQLFEDYRPRMRFDAVFATYVLEHVTDPRRLLARARKHWLRKGGRLAVVVPHALSLHRRLAVEMGLLKYPGELGETDRRMDHRHCFTCHEMQQLLVQAGFRIVESGGWFVKALPNRFLVHCSDAQLRGLFELGAKLPVEYAAIIYFLAENPA